MSCTNGHPADSVSLRRKKAIGGGDSFVLQCQACGSQVGGSVSIRRVPDPRNVPRFDLRLAHKPQPNARRREYQKHLGSAYWKSLRKRRFALDNYQCQVRVGVGICGELATDLAHLDYSNFGAERIEDVQSQCKAHNQGEREARITAAVLGGPA